MRGAGDVSLTNTPQSGPRAVWDRPVAPQTAPNPMLRASEIALRAVNRKTTNMQLSYRNINAARHRVSRLASTRRAVTELYREGKAKTSMKPKTALSIVSDASIRVWCGRIRRGAGSQVNDDMCANAQRFSTTQVCPNLQPILIRAAASEIR